MYSVGGAEAPSAFAASAGPQVAASEGMRH